MPTKKQLQEENKKCMEELAEAILVVKLMSKAEDLNLDLQGKMVEEIEELKEENEKLKEANDTFTLGAKRTIESNCKLYQENIKLKEQIEWIKRQMASGSTWNKFE